ncbi:MAG: DUF1553 domain-containing protein [Planctomycetes bacterium]|nr:DUF1553 domain-containing protein [Planctomycetota bacterium]
MNTRLFPAVAASLACVCFGPSVHLGAAEPTSNSNQINQILMAENAQLGVELQPMPIANDATFLRRVYVDMIGRIPTEAEIRRFAAMPKQSRRATLVDELIQNERFADTWTVFYADMLRLRSNADGGAAAIAFVHKAIEDGTPYDELARGFISANGKAGATPEVGFVLGDNADPMALAGVTSQVFLGVRVACAQCHDHPFDVWTQHDFYGLAAYFGKTRRVETQFTNTVYTTEANQSTVLWPPEGEADANERKPMPPRFPFALASTDRPSRYISRLKNLRAEQLVALNAKQKKNPEASIDDLLTSLDDKVASATRGKKRNAFDVAAEAKRDARNLKIQPGMASESELRAELAKLITDPKNRYFSRSFANRVWAHLVGRGFVEPIDDFSDNNPPSHPKTLDYIADEFVANGYDLKTLVRMIVTSEPYQRSHVYGLDDLTQSQLEESFLATPMRRMLSEVIYDSVVTAGHLFDAKHAAGKNLKTVWQQNRIAKASTGGESVADQLTQAGGAKMKALPGKNQLASAGSYNLESAIELDFDAILKKNKEAESVAIEKMKVMSTEQLEAMRMEQQARERRNVEYVDRFVKATIDDNPSFSSSFRMASPAAPEHFLRVFGQTSRTQLGEHRDQSPSMRQALMMLNGRLTHEASRVGELEPVFPLLIGETANLPQAIQLVYREILTRQPSSNELAEAKAIIADAGSPLEGVADLRWLLLNCDEFRFLP